MEILLAFVPSIWLWSGIYLYAFLSDVKRRVDAEEKARVAAAWDRYLQELDAIGARAFERVAMEMKKSRHYTAQEYIDAMHYGVAPHAAKV